MSIAVIPKRGYPTDYPAGSPGKKAVIAARIARREPAEHPDDSLLIYDGTPTAQTDDPSTGGWPTGIAFE